jgi:aquaporin Z
MNNLSIVAEFLGTFLLILSILVTGNAFFIGASLAVIILLIGGVSGAHVNPAVSLAMWLKGGLSMNEYLLYISAQMAGGASALYAYKALA